MSISREKKSLVSSYFQLRDKTSLTMDAKPFWSRQSGTAFLTFPQQQLMVFTYFALCEPQGTCLFGALKALVPGQATYSRTTVLVVKIQKHTLFVD